MDATFSALAIAQLWQVTALIVIVAVINRWLSRRRPHLAHVLWLVVLAKCLTPPLWSSTGGIFCWLQPEQVVETQVTQLDVEWEPVEWEELLVADSSADEWAAVQDDSFAAVPLSDAEAVELLGPEETTAATDWAAVLRTAWVVTVSFVLLIVVVRWWRFWRRLTQAPRRECPELDQQLTELARQLGVTRVRLLVTESRIGPAVVGLIRKTILLPAVVVDRLAAPVGRIKLCDDPARRESGLASTEQLEEQTEEEDCRIGAELDSAYDSLLPILAHELLHVRRGDLWVGMLQTITQAVWWFHPLVWWVGKATSREAERCCDEEVLAELNCDPATYARSLLDVLELKSQLAPVPVFPGVRPVDVTSNRLERIMTLGQGCRRRTPWWCWLIAIGAAALTLPGAAFVVSAQEKSTQAETPLNGDPVPLPALKAGSSPQPAPPALVDEEYRAYQIADRDSTITTVVYETAEFAHLLTGTQDEQQRKFEQLVRSRRPARETQINWFDGKPIVKTTVAGHTAVRKCLSMFVGSKATAETFDEFLESVAASKKSVLVCELQMVSAEEAAFSQLEDAVQEHSTDPDGSGRWVIPADKWNEALQSLRGDTHHISAPQVATHNGVNVQVESVAQHTAGLKREDDGGLTPCMNWSGWKTHLLPFARKDGSFWLGVWFEQGTVTDTRRPTEKEATQIGTTEPVNVHSYGVLNFAATLKEDQIVVFPGPLPSEGTDSEAWPLLTARIRRLSDKPDPNAIPSPRHISGNGANSDTTSTGQATLSLPPMTSSSYQILPTRQSLELADNGRGLIPFGTLPCFMSLENGDQLTSKTTSRAFNEPVVLTASRRPEQKTFSIRADRLAPFPEVPGLPIPLLKDIRLEVPNAGLIVKASLAVLSQPQGTPHVHIELMDAEFHRNNNASEQRWSAPKATVQIDSTNWNVSHIWPRHDSPGKAPSSQQVSGSTVRSDSGVTGEIELTSGVKRESSDWGSLKSHRIRRLLTRRPLGSSTLTIHGSNDGLRMSVKLENSDEKEVLGGTAEDVHIRSKPDSNVVEMQNAELRLFDDSTQKLVAAKLRILTNQGSDKKVQLELEDAAAWLTSTDRGISHLRADRISLVLSVDTIDIEKIDGEGLKLLKTDAPVIDRHNRLVTAAYPVADLVVPIPHRVVVHADQESGDKEWKIVNRKNGVVPAAEEASRKTTYDFDQLIELIESVVEPDSWDGNGGRGKIASNETTLSLVVRQTQQVHEEISDLLGQLRRLRDISVEVQTESLQLGPAVLQKLNLESEFAHVGDSSRMKIVRLTAAQAEQLRGQGHIARLPKVTLFNGQTCELALPSDAEDQSRLVLQTMISSDRRFVRLGVAGATSGTKPSGQLDALPAIPDGEAVLLELATPVDETANVVAVPIPGQPKAFRAVRPPRQFVLIQPRILIVEEEEELLGIEP